MALYKKFAIFLILTMAGLPFGGIEVNAAPGDLDSSLGNGGIAITPVGTGRDLAQASVLQADGKIVVAGSAQNDFALVRFNPDGTLDTAFGTGGKVLTPVTASSDEAFAVALQSDGKIVAAGKGFGDFAVVRYNTERFARYKLWHRRHRYYSCICLKFGLCRGCSYPAGR